MWSSISVDNSLARALHQLKAEALSCEVEKYIPAVPVRAGMPRMVGTRGSPRIHHDGPESFPLSDDNHAGRADAEQAPSSRLRQQQPVAMALDEARLRRLSFGGRGGATKKMLPALDRPRGEGGAGGPLVPLPLEKPKFHHGEARPKRPKV